MFLLKIKTLHKYIVVFVLALLYFFQVNIAQRIGVEHKYFNYLILLTWGIFFCICKPQLNKHKSEIYIILFSVIVLIVRYYLGMFEETVQTLFCAIFPALLYMMIARNEDDEENRQLTRRILLLFFVVNSCLAILEMFARTHLIGWYDVSYSEGFIAYASYSDFRAVALAGSPLNNALLTTTLNLYILFSNIKLKNKLLLFGLGFLAVLAFNARTATVINVIALILYYVKNFKNFSLKQQIYGLMGAALFLCCVAYLVFNTNMGSRLLNTESFEDDGSIAVRLLLFEEISNQNLSQFLWGGTLAKVRYLMQSFGVVIIENFWICYILHLGIIALGIFTYLYFKLGRRIFRGFTKYDSIVITLCFMLLASSNNSLYSGYTALFTFLIGGYAFKMNKNRLCFRI